VHILQFGITDGSGVALYDLHEVTLDPDTVKSDGIIDALVIATHYRDPNLLTDTLTPGEVPFVMNPR